MSTAAPTKLHPFYETLGPGPYRFVGCYDMGEAMDSTSAANFGNMRGWQADAPKLKAGLGTCAHCGMAIMLICIVQVGNGDQYGIGSDCVEKCSSGGIWKGAKAALASRRNEMARSRKAAAAAVKWEAGRDAREKAIAESLRELAKRNAVSKAEKLARFIRFDGVLSSLVDHITLAKWREDYTDEALHTFGHDAHFSPPCDASNFYHSLAIQLIAHGSLSPRQAEYATKAVMGRQTQKNTAAFDALKLSITNP
jgi:hypothetical protein